MLYHPIQYFLCSLHLHVSELIVDVFLEIIESFRGGFFTVGALEVIDDFVLAGREELIDLI